MFVEEVIGDIVKNEILVKQGPYFERKQADGGIGFTKEVG